MSSNLTASAKFEKPLLIAGAFFIYAFTPQNTPHQNLGALILSLLKVENENKKLDTI
ncbi:hypothetical protein IC800_12855 [Acinetobacter seifertii]|uniref:hypothetical protein n=1 Tax=Acinetobacter seifertii TaxID=1530123 RepID=UPI00168D682D|nr:hypothetical protein [Acinetobacter seifertii]QNW96528.1 hypothetical protein IC800_12855 [Acinetobacter seifertii]QNX03648.1 hypothetical protein IC798_13290 [Acinetobacter seifertii]